MLKKMYIKTKSISVLLVLAIIATFYTGSIYVSAADTNIALQATASASSLYSGSSADNFKDGVVAGYPADISKEWCSNGQKAGAWAQLTWSTAVTISKYGSLTGRIPTTR